jgi:hypothetical protein
VPSTLTIPGVQVRTQFEPLPVLPGATGILGVVGVADRGPVEPTPIGNLGELVDIFGPGSRYTMPEIRTGLANGVSQVVVARTAPGRGVKASLTLFDAEDEKVVTLRARAEGTWGNRLAVQVDQVRGPGGGVKYVNLEVTLDGVPVDTLSNLVMDPESPSNLFDRVNDGSRVLVAVDPEFDAGLPDAIASTPLADEDARAAFALLPAAAVNVVRAEAKRAGQAGNLLSVGVADGRAALLFVGTGDAPSVEIRARESGEDGTEIRVGVQPAAVPPGAVDLVVSSNGGPPRTIGPATTVDQIVALLETDPDVEALRLGDVLPVAVAPARLERRVEVTVFPEGRDPRRYEGFATPAAIAGINDTLIAFSVVGGATSLPDANEGLALASGRNRGPALALVGAGSDAPLLELVPAPGVTAALDVVVSQGISTLDGATPVINLRVFADDVEVESHSNLTMDPDDPGYMPDVLAVSSAFLRAHDLFVRSRTTSFPAATPGPQKLTGGESPTVDDYGDALARLESAEEVDLVIASAAGQLDDAGVRAAHQAVVAHCTKMADVARNRIGLGSVTASEASSVSAILDHADDVRSDHFVLTSPARSEPAVAGLLGRQDYFASPTFKTIASLDAPAGQYSDPQLTQLINGNVAVVNERRRLGIIVVKGILTSGRQISVQRTANKAVRDVKAICNVYIGLLNNEGARNALKQQITALLLQMERDGALVPSTDGTSPAFTVDVYSTQADFANGIVRVDLAVRPVRAIDFIYATILVRN